MKNHRRPKKWNTLALILLALVCIVSVELAVCRFAAPALFEQITAPVHSAAAQVGAWCRSLSAQIQESGLFQQEEAPPVNQLAGTPALSDTMQAESPGVTSYELRGGQEILTGGSVPLVYYNQGEEPWREMPFGPDEIGGYGCGPTSMAMVVSTLTDQTVDPGQMAQWAYENGYCAPGSGSYHSIVEGTAKAYGLKAESQRGIDQETLLEMLTEGNLFVALMTRGHFTNGGHFIVLRGVTMDGQVLVADPNGRDRSLVAWDPQLLLDELSPNTHNGSPLWSIAIPR